VHVAVLPGSMRGRGGVVGAGGHSAAGVVPRTFSAVADHALRRWDALGDVLQHTM